MNFLIKEIVHKGGFFSQNYSVGDTISTETLIKLRFVFNSYSSEDIIVGMAFVATLELVEED